MCIVNETKGFKMRMIFNIYAPVIDQNHTFFICKSGEYAVDKRTHIENLVKRISDFREEIEKINAKLKQRNIDSAKREEYKKRINFLNKKIKDFEQSIYIVSRQLNLPTHNVYRSL